MKTKRKHKFVWPLSDDGNAFLFIVFMFLLATVLVVSIL